jgi:hypothetical protein
MTSDDLFRVVYEPVLMVEIPVVLWEIYDVTIYDLVDCVGPKHMMDVSGPRKVIFFPFKWFKFTDVCQLRTHF